MRMVDLASEANAVLMTTTKDHVRLPAEAREMARPLPVTVRWDGVEMISGILRSVSNPDSGGRKR